MLNMTKIKSRILYFKQVRTMISIIVLVFGCLFVFPMRSLAVNYIEESTARSVALKHAGFSEADVTFIKLARYDRRRIELYDIEFLSTS
jgi:hypothetical protein